MSLQKKIPKCKSNKILYSRALFAKFISRRCQHFNVLILIYLLLKNTHLTTNAAACGDCRCSMRRLSTALSSSMGILSAKIRSHVHRSDSSLTGAVSGIGRAGSETYEWIFLQEKMKEENSFRPSFNTLARFSLQCIHSSSFAAGGAGAGAGKLGYNLQKKKLRSKTQNLHP